jgi:tRNA A37 methylthiotransferase MiaB
MARGCPRSTIDLGKICAYFEINGWIIEKHIQHADLVVVSTCGVDQKNENASIKLLLVADKKKRPDSPLVVIGCLAGINPILIQQQIHAHVIAPKDLDQFDELIQARVKLEYIHDLNYVVPYTKTAWDCFSYADRHENASRLKAFVEDTKSSVSAWLISTGMERAIGSALYNLRTPCKGKDLQRLEPYGNVCSIRVAHGCLGKCTYCAIRFATGPLRSKPLDRVIEELKTSIQQRFSYIRIIADDVGAYGQDTGGHVVDLFTAIFQQEGRYKLIVRSINPEWLIQYCDELIPLFSKNAHKIHYLSFPIQSGSDRILRLMNRRYSSSQIRDCFSQFRKACPDIILDTQVIVGFPTETHTDIEDTIAFLRDAAFDRIIIYQYADRPLTPASAMSEKVPDTDIFHRIAALQDQCPPESLVIQNL